MIADLDLQVDLGHNAVVYGDRAVRVKPKIAEVIHVLQRSYPHAMSRHKLSEAIWGKLTPPSRTNFDQTMYQARKAIAPLGWSIRNIHTVGFNLARVTDAK